jgi:hypothetical protein
MSDESTVLPGSTGQETPATEQVQAAPFYETQGPDGKSIQFKTREELDKAWKDSVMLRSDYTKKTQLVAQQRAEFEKRMKDFDEQQKMFSKSKAQYDEWDRLLKSRPEIQRELMNRAKAPASPNEVFERAQGLVDETKKQMEERIEKLEKALEQKAFQDELQSHHQTLAKEFEDYDPEAVTQLLQEVSGGDTATLLRNLYYARKGQTPPEEAQKRVLEKIEQKRKAGVVPSSKGTPPPSSNGHETSIKAIRQRMKAEAHGG